MKALITGCGPGGGNWREVYDAEQPDITIVTNSAIVECADIADYFVVVENLGPDPAKDHPWILTETDAHLICNSKTLRRLGEHGDDPCAFSCEPYDRPTTPIIYPQSSVGTVLYYILDMANHGDFDKLKITINDKCSVPITEVHLVGFPLCFDGDTQHWTEDKQPYTVGASHYLPGNVFVRINGLNTIWQFAMAAAFVSVQPWPFKLINHGGGLLDIPTIGDMWQFATGEPNKTEYEV